MDLQLSVLDVCTLSFYHKSLSLSCNWMKEGERLLVSSKNMSKKTTMTDLCAYLTTFFLLHLSRPEQREEKSPIRRHNRYCCTDCTTILSTANRVIQYYGESLFIVFHTTFSVINIIYNREQLYIHTMSLQSPTIYRKRWTLSFLACPCIKDRTYELLRSFQDPYVIFNE